MQTSPAIETEDKDLPLREDIRLLAVSPIFTPGAPGAAHSSTHTNRSGTETWSRWLGVGYRTDRYWTSAARRVKRTTARSYQN